MVQPTDRVIAKILARVIRKLFTDANIPPIEGALVLAAYTQQEIGDNKSLAKAVVELLRESSQELRAEGDGGASSIISSPVAAPWNEDAGSGDFGYGDDNWRKSGIDF